MGIALGACSAPDSAHGSGSERVTGKLGNRCGVGLMRHRPDRRAVGSNGCTRGWSPPCARGGGAERRGAPAPGHCPRPALAWRCARPCSRRPRHAHPPHGDLPRRGPLARIALPPGAPRGEAPPLAAPTCCRVRPPHRAAGRISANAVMSAARPTRLREQMDRRPWGEARKDCISQQRRNRAPEQVLTGAAMRVANSEGRAGDTGAARSQALVVRWVVIEGRCPDVVDQRQRWLHPPPRQIVPDQRAAGAHGRMLEAK